MTTMINKPCSRYAERWRGIAGAPLTVFRRKALAVTLSVSALWIVSDIGDERSAHAQTSSSVAESTAAAGAAKQVDQKAEPKGGPGLKADLGYRRLFANDTNSTYYKIDFQGRTLTTHGTAFSDASSYTSFPTFSNDDPALQLKIERGVTKASGPLADYLQLTNLPGIRGIRGVVQGYGTLDDLSSLGFVIGIERRPISARIRSVPNFLTVGLQSGTQPVSSTSASAAAGTEGNTGNNHRDVGIFAFRQYAGYSPLTLYSDFRKRVRKLATDLPANTVITLNDFYPRVQQGDDTVLDALPDAAAAAEEDPTKADALRKVIAEDLAALTPEDRKTLVGDFVLAAPFSLANFAGASTDAGNAIIRRLPATGGSEQQQALPNAVEKAANPPAGARIGDWRSSPDKAVAAASAFVGRGGIALDSKTGAGADKNMSDASKEEKATYLSNRRRYVKETLKITDAKILAAIDRLLTVAYQQDNSSDKDALLIAANRVLLVSSIPELATFGNVARGLKPTLLNMYAHPDRAPFILLAENTGQYYFSGDDGNSVKSRLNSLFAASLTVYANPSGDQRSYVRLRYENGRNRAAPTIYLNQITVAAGLEFK